MSEKTPWKKIVSDPNYIGEADFQENEEKVLTIDRVAVNETVITAEGKSKKQVVHWKEMDNKPMILNVARSKNIEKVSGSRFIEDWSGVQIQLYIEHGIKAFGEVVSAVRVRPFKPCVQEKQPVPPCTDCKKEITPAMGKSAEYMAAYTAKHYGVPLCAGCAQKRKAEAVECQSEEETDADRLADAVVASVRAEEEPVPASDPETGEVL